MVSQITLEQEIIDEILSQCKTIAVVGLSPNPLRTSNSVSNYMNYEGYKIVPVNPNCTEAMGQKSYPTLSDIPFKIDLVNVFRKPDFVPTIVKECIDLEVEYIWLQEGVVNRQAYDLALEKGIKIIMDRCIFKEHRKWKLNL